MLNDEQLEDLLRRYRVVDPRPELGEAITRPTSVEEPAYMWLWGPAVAATVLITWLTVQMSMLARPMDAVRDAEVAFASEMLGGGEGVTDYVRIVIPVRDQESIDLLSEEPWQRP